MKIYLEDNPDFGLQVDIVRRPWDPDSPEYDPMDWDPDDWNPDDPDNAPKIMFRNPVSYGWNTDPELALVGWSEQSDEDNRLWKILVQRIDALDEEVIYGSIHDIPV